MAFPLHPFKPYLLKSLRAYDSEQFSSDLIAGRYVVLRRGRHDISLLTFS